MSGPSRTWAIDRTFAFGILTILIGSIVTQGFIAIQWGRDRERFEAASTARHIFTEARLEKLEDRPFAAIDAGQRIATLEAKWKFIQENLESINDKLDRVMPLGTDKLTR